MGVRAFSLFVPGKKGGDLLQVVLYYCWAAGDVERGEGGEG